MKLIDPKTTELLASNVTEEAFDLWVTTTSYSAGTKVYVLFSNFDDLIDYGDCSFDGFASNDATSPTAVSFNKTSQTYDFDGTQSSTIILYQVTDKVTSGDEYLVTFEIKNYTAGNIRPYLQNGVGTQRSADGIYQEVVTAAGADTWIGLRCDSAFNGSVTNISIKPVGDYVGRMIYESQTGSNQGNFPPHDTDSTNWAKYSASNRWKMFDDYMQSQTIRYGDISVKVKADGCNALGFTETDAETIQYILSNDAIYETSTTSITPGTGDQSFTFTAANTWGVDASVEIYRTSDQRCFMAGDIKTDDAAGGITVTVDTYDDPEGAGPYTDWTMVLVYDNETVDLFADDQPLDLEAYFFDPVVYTDADIYTLSISFFTSCRVIISASSTSEKARCGHLIVGYAYEFGTTVAGSFKGRTYDFSDVEANTFGEYSVVERDDSKESSMDILVDADIHDRVFQILRSVKAKPCYWDGNNTNTDYSAARVFGFLWDWDFTDLENNTEQFIYHIETKGLT